MARKIILDVDTGSDDAVAIMAAIASPDIELLACCTVFGNLDVEHTTDNTLRLLQAMHCDAPVYRGCSHAMAKHVEPARKKPPAPNTKVDGKEVCMHYEELNLPKTTRRPEEQSAVAFYIETLRRAAEPVTIVAVAPLTNVGMALSIAPDIAENIREIVIMGGGDRVTATSLSSTANIFNDPEAAEIIMRSGVPVLWVATDATYTACLSLDDCKRLRALDTFAANFVAELVEQRVEVHNALIPLDVPNAAAVHDALCVLVLIDEAVLPDIRPVALHVGLRGFGDGKTVIDRRSRPEDANCRFAFFGDRFRFIDMLCELFAK